MAWCFEDEQTDATEAVLDMLQHDEAWVPAVWPLEVANLLLVAERSGRLTEAQASHFLALLNALPIEVDQTGSDTAGIVATGRRHHLTSYDASYLVLAERSGAPLATVDAKLATAARDAGVRLLLS